MNKNFDDFINFMQSIIQTLCENPGVRIDGQFSSYDRSRHRVSVLVITTSGDLYSAEFQPECPPDLPDDEPTPYAALIKWHLDQQLTLANSIAQKVHALAWKADHARRGQSH